MVVPSGISVVIVVSTLIVDVILGSSVAGSPWRGCRTFQSRIFYPHASIPDFSTMNSTNMNFSFMNYGAEKCRIEVRKFQPQCSTLDEGWKVHGLNHKRDNRTYLKGVTYTSYTITLRFRNIFQKIYTILFSHLTFKCGHCNLKKLEKNCL